MLVRSALLLGLLGLLVSAGGAQETAPPARQAQQEEEPREAPRSPGWERPSDSPPRSAREKPYSSSRDTQGESQGPVPEAVYQPGPGSTPPVGGVHELRPYNPHRAMKNVEVGEYYLKRKRYPAALSRFREALEHKPNDAHATYRVAETLEKMGRLEEALSFYRAYLAILPEGGRFSEQSHKAVQRVENQRVENQRVEKKISDQAEKASTVGARHP